MRQGQLKIMGLFIRLAKILTLVVLGCVLVSGQQIQQQPSASPSNPNQTQPQTPASSNGTPASVGPNLPNSNGLAQPSFLTPIFGLQGVFAETVEGNPVAAQSIDAKFNPASSVKLAMALVALQTFGPEHRFLTSVWAAGTIDKTNGTLTGDLVISGRDPSFHYEHAVMLAREVNALGIRTVKGNLIVAPGFTLNCDWWVKHSGKEFRATFDAARRSGNATRAWIEERTLVSDNQSLSSVPSVVITGEVQVGNAPAGAIPLLAHKSGKLVDVLKALLCYSNNFMAERIGESLGGHPTIRAALIDKLKINPDEISMSSTSGLGVNRFTPRAMMKILRGLRQELQKN